MILLLILLWWFLKIIFFQGYESHSVDWNVILERISRNVIRIIIILTKKFDKNDEYELANVA